MELLPCPFCGNNAEKILTIVECKKCKIFMDNEEEWNTRHSQWISVDKIMPDGGYNLCLTHDENIKKMFFNVDREMWSTQDGEYYPFLYVTHWMPSPQPPKEDKHE